MELLKKLDWENLKHEYGVDGQRFLPWGEKKFPFPFGGAFAIVRSGTVSLNHVNAVPPDEEELFICVSGTATVLLDDKAVEMKKGDMVFVPSGVSHYIKNDSKEDFHFITVWWNMECINGFVKEKAATNV